MSNGPQNPPNENITKEEWRDRFIHIAGKCAVILGLNEEEMEWVRDGGYDCYYEDDDS